MLFNFKLFTPTYIIKIFIFFFTAIMEEIENSINCGKPIPIVLAEERHHFILDDEALESILLKDDIKDRNVVVVSVAGAFRKGKSFLLDFFLRYMKATVNNNHTYTLIIKINI